MPDLVFTAFAQLLRRDEVLASLKEYEGSRWGCLLVDGRRYVIEHRARLPWHHPWHLGVVMVETGENVCDYSPFHLARGGLMLGGATDVTLLGLPFRLKRC